MEESKLFVQKYCPKNLAELHTSKEKSVSDIVDILHIAICADLPILLIGDVGHGKTTYLKAIIAEYYRGTDPVVYQSNIMHLNMLLDQGIQHHRAEFKTFAQSYSVVPGKKKIVMLDDLDMMQDHSQHFFRSCMSAYGNVLFIAACTNQQKVIESLQSHLFLVHIPTPSDAILGEIAGRIITAERIQIDSDAVAFLISISNSSIKTLTHFLEMLTLYAEPVNLKQTQEICTNMHYHLFQQYLDCLMATPQRLNEAIALLNSVYDSGISVVDILDCFFTFMSRFAPLSDDIKYAIAPLLTQYVYIFHSVHEDEIELALFTNRVAKVFANKP